MSDFLKAEDLWPGLVLNMSSTSKIGKMIRWALGPAFRWLQEKFPDLAGAVCPNHDAIVVEKDGVLYIGEAAFPTARLRTLDQYNEWIATGRQFNVRILAPKGVTKPKQRKAAKYWMENISGTLYDFKAIPYLGAKALFGGWISKVQHWEYAWYCTEGVADSYTWGAGYPVWEKKLPTPLTTLKRYCEGHFRLIKKS